MQEVRDKDGREIGSRIYDLRERGNTVFQLDVEIAGTRTQLIFDMEDFCRFISFSGVEPYLQRYHRKHAGPW